MPMCIAIQNEGDLSVKYIVPKVLPICMRSVEGYVISEFLQSMGYCYMYFLYGCSFEGQTLLSRVDNVTMHV